MTAPFAQGRRGDRMRGGRHRRSPSPAPRRSRLGMGVVLAVAVAAALALRSCPLADREGRPLWRVATVHDGDTVTCLDDQGRPQKIRLRGIDAPEFGQPFGDAARRVLVGKLAGGVVRVDGGFHDQHGRLLGTLWIGDRNLNRELVAEGLAWVFGGFAPDEDLLAAEAAARRQRRGLWADESPVEPRQWRDAHSRAGGR